MKANPDKTTRKYLKAAAVALAVVAGSLIYSLNTCKSPKDSTARPEESLVKSKEFGAAKPAPEKLRKLADALALISAPSPLPRAEQSFSERIFREFPPGSLECPDIFLGESEDLPAMYGTAVELFHLLGEQRACEYGINVTMTACPTPLTDELYRLARAKDANSILAALKLMGEEDLMHSDNPHKHLDPIGTYTDRRMANNPLVPDPDCVGRNIYLNKMEFLTLEAFISLIHENENLGWMVNELPESMKEFVENELLRLSGKGNIPYEDFNKAVAKMIAQQETQYEQAIQASPEPETE